MEKNIVLVGGGGHCRSCIDVIENEAKYKIFGIIDKKENIGKKVFEYCIIGCDEELNKFLKKCQNLLITIGFVKSVTKRLELYKKIKEFGGQFPVIKSRLAYTSKSISIGEGTIVLHYSFINSGVSIGNNCIINSKSLIEHDCLIGHHVHIAPGAIVNGECEIGNRVLIGSGAVLKEGIKIIDDVIIGAGAIVVKNISEPGIYYGNPLVKIS